MIKMIIGIKDNKVIDKCSHVKLINHPNDDRIIGVAEYQNLSNEIVQKGTKDQVIIEKVNSSKFLYEQDIYRNLITDEEEKQIAMEFIKGDLKFDYFIKKYNLNEENIEKIKQRILSRDF